jgi:hypothetical protein
LFGASCAHAKAGITNPNADAQKNRLFMRFLSKAVARALSF